MQLALEQCRRAQMLASAILYVVHPGLYLLARRVIERLARENEQNRDGGDSSNIALIERWASVFFVCDFLVNRESPLHRDCEPPAGWLDILFTVGDYRSCVFQAETVGITFWYPPGTALIVNGSRVLHGASLADGSRAAIISYLRGYMAKVYDEPLVAGSTCYP